MSTQLTFADLGVGQPTISALAARGIVEPFPIQAETLPDTLARRDVLGDGFALLHVDRHAIFAHVQQIRTVVYARLCVIEFGSVVFLTSHTAKSSRERWSCE